VGQRQKTEKVVDRKKAVLPLCSMAGRARLPARADKPVCLRGGTGGSHNNAAGPEFGPNGAGHPAGEGRL
jgi:hypothetical protein